MGGRHVRGREGTGQALRCWRDKCWRAAAVRRQGACQLTAPPGRHVTAIAETITATRCEMLAGQLQTTANCCVLLMLLRRESVTHVVCHHQFLGRPTRHISTSRQNVRGAVDIFHQSVAVLRLERTASNYKGERFM